MDVTIGPNPFLPLVDLAHHTKNVRLGTDTVIAPFWHPIRLAGEAAAADQIPGGRIELGIARGAYSHEFGVHSGFNIQVTPLWQDMDEVETLMGRFNAACFQNQRPTRNSMVDPLTEDEIAATPLRDLTIATVQQVIDRLKRYEDLGYDDFSFWIDSGMSFERKRASLLRFIGGVIPAFA